MKLNLYFRATCRTLHEWLGLASCLLVFILCFTGSVLVLQEPVTSWLNRPYLRVESTAKALPLAELIAKQAPGQGFTGLMLPADPQEALRFRKGRETIYINPLNGERMQPQHQAVHEGFMFAFRLHRWLLLDPAWGRPITGAATVIFLLTLFSGLGLWLPQRLNQWGRAWRFNPKLQGQALLREWHVVLGLYAAPFLFVMGLTALFWSYNSSFEHISHRILDGKAPPASSSRTAPPAQPSIALNWDAILATTNRVYPEPGLTFIRFPASADGPVTVSRSYPGEALRLPRRDELTVHGQSGALIEGKRFADRSRAERFLARIRDWHTGTILGTPSLVLYLLACSIGTSLPLTGSWYWWRKVQARRRASSSIPQRQADQA